MSFSKKTVRDVNVSGKRGLLRADFNVPVDDEGKIQNDYRIQSALPTIQYLLDKGAKLIICSHLGRPEGKPDARFSLKKVAVRLEKLLKRDVKFINDCVGEEVEAAAKKLKTGEILLLENLRF